MFRSRTLVGSITKSLFRSQYSNVIKSSLQIQSSSSISAKRSFCSTTINTNNNNVINELKSRGFIYQMTASEQEMIELTNAKKPISLYAGFDPTADSLHIGNLLTLMVLLHFKRHGHNPIALVGGATALIGDPSGKSTDRPLLDTDFIANNIKYIRENITSVLGADVQLVNNYDWNKDISIIHFLRDIGTYFRVGSMIKKDFIQNRIGGGEGNTTATGNDPNGISYTEFSYALLQSNDFLHLKNTQNCMIQIGGSDQWGNITDGCELIKKKTGKPGYGITIPLLTNAQGKKLGKSEGNSIWLAPHRTSPFYFYQYWIQVSDQDIERFLKLFTLLSLEEIASIVHQHNEAPHKRIGQKAIAEGVTTIVHGKRGLEEALATTDLLFANKLQDSIEGFDVGFLLSRANAIELSKTESMGVRVVDIFAKVSGMSKAQVKTLISSKSLYINSEPIQDIQTTIKPESLIANEYMIFRYGKKAYYLVKFV